jgi:hypothetical protein
MIKKNIKYFIYSLTILIIILGYLSYFGVETKRFNGLIKDTFISNKNVNIDLKTIKILLNLKNLSFTLKTKNPEISFEDKKIKLESIKTNLLISSLFNKNFSVKKLEISTKEVEVKDIIFFLKIYKNSPQLFILKNILKDGYIVADIKLNFDKNGKILDNYEVKGSVKKIELKLLNKKNIHNLNFNFKVKNKEYFFTDLVSKFDELNIFSKSIKIKDTHKTYLVEGNLDTKESEIKPNLLLDLLQKDLNNLKIENLNFASSNKFSFKLDKSIKIRDLKFNSKIKLNNLDYRANLPIIKIFLPKFDNKIVFKQHIIEIIFNKKKLSLSGEGQLSVDNKNDLIKYKIIKDQDNYNFDIKTFLKENLLVIDFLRYEKKENIKSTLGIIGEIKNYNKIYFKTIKFKENKNEFTISGLDLNKEFKINGIDDISYNFTNKKKLINNINIKKNRNNYQIKSKNFDASYLLDTLLKTNNDNNVFDLFNNLNTNIDIIFDKTSLDESTFVNNINGEILIIKNKIYKLNLQSKFNNQKILFTINTNEDNEKITTLVSDHPKPLIKRYKFIKGFEEGVLDFYSIKKNEKSKSVLKIDNFKIQEVPVLAKLLTLASLQGIADLLTGEGIRFTDFEMNFSNSNNLMTINELYAIGPAISIMMDGYIDNNNLISLRGTLVPATTINRTISSIPVIGNILVGKKVGEGVFGISFKIKGMIKDLKTSVNPIKTLTPRFITRTLEKIKKN